ncbi:NACHT domain-containing protein, partial [Mastigocoleus sp. MO_188.B34]|uniref:WD40 domain-containing protein n=1 Tax=Mastigocoleus sp. MO_188.B34 TaxID=3036635 RepID=UPI00262906B7
ALVEYGIGKPRAILQLFRQEEVQKAFRQAFDADNPSIVIAQIEQVLEPDEWNILQEAIAEEEIDVIVELAEFSAVFIKVVELTRTPAEVRRDRNITDLQQELEVIKQQLHQLRSLEEIQTELAKLTSQSSRLLVSNQNSGGRDAIYRVSTNGPNPARPQCKAAHLAEQLRGWFTTLGYGFEKYEVWETNHFEWIIKIQGRRRFDRILVRGIDGEAKISDLTALRQSVENQKTDEGWLIAARRISRLARNEVNKSENEDLFCYTLDELIDETADFSNYINWLSDEVKKRKIDQLYVPLACTKEEFDPVTKQRMGINRYEEEDGWIDGYIDLWLDDPAKEHLSVLGEFGTGKTWVAFHYAWTALQKYQEAKQKGLTRPRLPLVILLRDYAKALDVENVMAGFFYSQHEISLNSSVFDQLNRMGKLLLIFDGFDEMAARVDRQQMINNFWELAQVVVPGAKVILTCRTEHFPEAKEGRSLLNAELRASVANLTAESPQFEVLELEKFNDEQIRQVFSHVANTDTVDKVMNNPQLLDLARRPVMSDLILEALPDIEAGKPVDMSRVYLYAVRRKMERDIKSERTFTSLADKMYFLCEIAWEMLSTDQMSLNYRLFPDRIRHLFGEAVQQQKDLDHWHYDMMGQTMLVRNADGDYAPAHRSLLEFFVAYKFAAELGVLAEDFLEVVQPYELCIDRNAAPQEYTWSEYCQLQVEKRKKNHLLAPLKGFRSEDLGRLRETVGQAPLAKAVLDLLVGMVDTRECRDATCRVSKMLEVIESTRGKSEGDVGYVGGNTATLLVRIDRGALKGRNLSGAIIKEADFIHAKLKGVNFAEANLSYCIFPKSFGVVFTVTYSPDGKFFATGDANCEVTLWRVADHQPISSFKGHTGWVRSVVFSPDGNKLVSGGYDNTVKVWDIATGECLKTCKEHTSRIYSVAISPNGKTLASGSSDQSIKLWNIETGECFKTLQGHTDLVRAVTISPDNKTVASVSYDKSLKIWDVATGECLKTLEGHIHEVRAVAFVPGSNIIGSGSYDHTIKLWNVNTGRCIKTLQSHTNWVPCIAFSSDAKILASVSYDKTAKLWDVHTGECLKTLEGHTNWIRAVGFSPDDTTLITAGDDQTIRQWDVSSGECIATSQGCPSAIHSVVISPDSTTLVSSSEDQTLKLWDINTGKLLKSLRGHTSRVNSVAFSPDGTTVASVSYDRTIKLWDIKTRECLTTLNGHSWAINCVAFAPDGNTIATGGSIECGIKLWDVKTGEYLNTLYGHDDWIWSVSFSPDSKILASGSSDQSVKLWDMSTGECLKTLQSSNLGINTLAFGLDSTTLAIGCTDHTIKLWDICTKEDLKTLQGHTNSVLSVVFSPDGKTLASGSDDETVKLWDIQTMKCLKTFKWDNDGVNGVAISSDGNILVAGGWDGTIKIWNIKTGECIKTLSNKPYADMNITGATGLTPEQKASLKALGAVEED